MKPPSASGAQQRLDRAALVHRAVTLGHVVKRQGQVEHLPGIDLPAPHQLDQLGQVATHRSGTAVEANVSEEQLLAIELDSVRDANVAHLPAFPAGTDRLQHRLLSSNALQNRVSTDSVGQLL